MSNQGEILENNANLLAQANNHLAVLLHKKLSDESEENVFFSPFSISVAMAMLLRGTKEDSLEEMRKTLGYKKVNLADHQVHDSFSNLLELISKNKELYTLAIANAVVSHKDFQLIPDYKSDLQTIYRALALEVDFMMDTSNAVKQINDWVKENTRGKIPKVFDSLDTNTVMVLLNAVYFKGSWLIQFDPKNTQDGIFYNRGLKENTKNVAMMYKSEKFFFVEKDTFKALELPYKGEDISMMLLLPHELFGIKALEENMDSNFVHELRKDMHKVKVEVTLPKLHLEYSKGLKVIFQQLGLQKIFDHQLANFKGLSECDQLEVSEIIHKAVIDVNEEGSEAAAVTAVVMVMCCLVIDPEFKADHPFIFVIYDKRNDMILFMGRVNEM